MQPMEKITRNQNLHLRILPSELEEIRHAAGLDDRSVADWSRRALREAAQKRITKAERRKA